MSSIHRDIAIFRCFESASKPGKLESEREDALKITDSLKCAETFRDKLHTTMTDLREDIDALETLIPRKLWPVPTYADLLFKL